MTGCYITAVIALSLINPTFCAQSQPPASPHMSTRYLLTLIQRLVVWETVVVNLFNPLLWVTAINGATNCACSSEDLLNGSCTRVGVSVGFMGRRFQLMNSAKMYRHVSCELKRPYQFRQQAPDISLAILRSRICSAIAIMSA